MRKFIAFAGAAMVAISSAAIAQEKDQSNMLKKKEFPPGSIFTNNQSGGNNTVYNNYARPPQRTIGDRLRQQLMEIPKSQEVHVDATMGDGEAQTLALEIHAFLRAKGQNLDGGVSSTVYQFPPPPLELNTKDPNHWEIVVGSNR